jgi:hypothetical protein
LFLCRCCSPAAGCCRGVRARILKCAVFLPLFGAKVALALGRGGGSVKLAAGPLRSLGLLCSAAASLSTALACNCLHLFCRSYTHETNIIFQQFSTGVFHERKNEARTSARRAHGLWIGPVGGAASVCIQPDCARQKLRAACGPMSRSCSSEAGGGGGERFEEKSSGFDAPLGAAPINRWRQCPVSVFVRLDSRFAVEASASRQAQSVQQSLLNRKQTWPWFLQPLLL